jgi:hypothetical protein
MRRKFKKESGASNLLILGLIVPALAITAFFGLGMEGFHEKRSSLQNIADGAVLYGANFLPDLEESREQTLKWLTKRGFEEFQKEIEVEADRVKLSLNYQLEDHPASLLKALVDANKHSNYTKLTASATAEAKLAPKNFILAIDNGNSSAPKLDKTQRSWGNSLDWPEAEWINANRDEKLRRFHDLSGDLLTQQCFNPTFYQQKLFSLQLINRYLENPSNAVGFYALDTNGELALLRGTEKKGRYPEADWLFAEDRTDQLRDEECILISDYERREQKYAARDLIELAKPITLDRTQELSGNFYENLTLKQKIWSLARRASSQDLLSSVSKLLDDNNSRAVKQGELLPSQIYLFISNRDPSQEREALAKKITEWREKHADARFYSKFIYLHLFQEEYFAATYIDELTETVGKASSYFISSGIENSQINEVEKVIKRLIDETILTK